MFVSFVLTVAASAAAPGDFLADLELFKARSLAVRSDRQAFDAARSASLSRLLQFTPKASVAAGREWDRLDAPTATASSDTHFWYWRAGIDWNLFRGGGDYLAWRAAKNAEDSSRFEVKNQELKTELDGANVIFRRLFLRDAQGAQVELLKLKQETLRIGRDRYRQGKIPLQDVLKLEVDLSQQQNVVRQSEVDLAENEAAYRSFFVDDLKTNAWPLEGKATDAAPAGVSFEQQRLRARADSLDLTWRSSVTRHVPSLDFALSYKKYPLEGPASALWSGTLELSLPIWTRYETASENAQAYAAAVRAEGEATQNARDEDLRREFLRKKVSLSRASLEEARSNLDRADRLYRDMLRSFQLGRLSTNDLFQEQNRKIRAIQSLAQSRLDYHSSVMEACSLRGLAAVDCFR
jgi:outer membrane protein TolC